MNTLAYCVDALLVASLVVTIVYCEVQLDEIYARFRELEEKYSGSLNAEEYNV